MTADLPFGSAPPNRSSDFVLATAFNGFGMSFHVLPAQRAQRIIVLTMPRMGCECDEGGDDLRTILAGSTEPGFADVPI